MFHIRDYMLILVIRTIAEHFVLWDNGDYIIEVSANLDRDSTMDLLEINKL